VDPDRDSAGSNHGFGERIERGFRILVVDADPAFHRDLDGDRRAHRRDAIADECRRAHKAGAEGARLHAVGRAADIEVDLVIAVGGRNARGLGELRRLRAAELDGDGMLLVGKGEQPIAVAMDDGIGDDHLRVKERAPRQPTMEDPAVAVGPVHHRCNGKAAV
jgi:hypothetical protein